MTKKLLKLNLTRFGTTTPVDPTTSNTHVSENFGKLLEPGLNKIFFETYDEIPEQYSKIFNVQTSNKATETDYGLGAFGDWKERGSELDVVDYCKLSTAGEITYTHKEFTKGFMIGRKLYDDEQYKQISKFPKAMARAGRAKVEKDAMQVLLKGFPDGTQVGSVTLSGAPKGRDGKTLFAKDHGLVDKSGTTCSNLIEGELNEENLKKAMQMMREVKDEAGNLVQFKATRLIIPPALEDTARRLLHSTQVPGGNLNDTNEYLKDSMQIVVMDYLSASAGGSDTVWFLQDGSRHELNFFWRVKPEFKWDESFDTLVAKYRGYMRYSMGFSDWRGMVGSTGAPASDASSLKAKTTAKK